MMASSRTIAAITAYNRIKIFAVVCVLVIIAMGITLAVVLPRHHHHHTAIPTVTLTSFTATPFSRSSTATSTWNVTLFITKPSLLIAPLVVTLEYLYTNFTGLPNKALLGDQLLFQQPQTLLSGSMALNKVPADVAPFLISDQNRGLVLADVSAVATVKQEGNNMKTIAWMCSGVKIRFNTTTSGAAEVPIKCQYVLVVV